MAEPTETYMASHIPKLKNELLKAVKTFVEEDGYGIEEVNEVLGAFTSLARLKFKKKSKSSSQNEEPEEFKCPISKQLMSDPVVLATGKTYDRCSIELWLSKGNLVCPLTQEVLDHTNLIPNYLVKIMISKWCNDHNFKIPPPAMNIIEDMITSVEQVYIDSLLEKLSSSSVSDQKQALKDILLLLRFVPSFVASLSLYTNNYCLLLNPQAIATAEMDPEFKEDLATAFFTVPISITRKPIIAKYPPVIPMVLESLKSTRDDTREAATATLLSFVGFYAVKLLVLKAGALKCLIDYLDRGDHEVSMNDAAKTMCTLCGDDATNERAVHLGAVPVIVKRMKECSEGEGEVDKPLLTPLLRLLSKFAEYQPAVEEMGSLDVVPYLLEMVKHCSVVSQHNVVQARKPILKDRVVNPYERVKGIIVEVCKGICHYDMLKYLEIKEWERKNGISLNITSALKSN